MSANPNPPVANMHNLMIQLGAAAPNTVISGSAYSGAIGSPQVARVSAKKASKRR
jgi:hypothetical protein